MKTKGTRSREAIERYQDHEGEHGDCARCGFACGDHYPDGICAGFVAKSNEGRPLESLTAAWHVQAGAIAGKGREEYDRLFVYTAADEETDRANVLNPAYQTIFFTRQIEATAYLFHVSNPRLNKWSELTFQWF